MLGPQVAVTVANEPGAGPSEKLLAPAALYGRRQPLGIVELFASGGDQRSQRGEVLVEHRPQSCDRSPGLAGGRGGGMELRKPAADGADFRFPRCPDGQPS